MKQPEILKNLILFLNGISISHKMFNRKRLKHTQILLIGKNNKKKKNKKNMKMFKKNEKIMFNNLFNKKKFHKLALVSWITYKQLITFKKVCHL